MSAINIRRDVTDPFYRYKMPRLIGKIEGRGNGIKTVVVNLADIAKALRRPPMYPAKFFGFELGAQVIGDLALNRYVITGAHDTEKLASTLDQFIEKFVLCPSCKNPETDLVVSQGIVHKDCKACGKKGKCDNVHKLITYVLRQTDTKKSKKDKKDKADVQVTEQGKSYDDADELTRKIQSDAMLLPDSESAHEFIEDTSPEAVAKRQEELALSGAVAKLLIGDDDEEDPFEEFAEFVQAGNDPDSILAKSEELGLRRDKACVVLCQSMLSESVVENSEIETQLQLFKLFVTDEKCEKAVLGGIERLVSELFPTLLPKVALIFKELYQHDLVSEATFLQWAEKPSKKYVKRDQSKLVHDHAEPFIAWLREAEEETDSEEEEDE